MKVHIHSSISRLMLRKSMKNARLELLKNYSKDVSKAKKSEYSRTVSASGIRIELSSDAKDYLRNKYIDKVLESGEPLHGISYDDYFFYYKDKHGFISDQIEREYKQALKGDNASLREKEWRTNPDYLIPQRIWDDPIVAADRDAAIEKIRNDEELEDWEKTIIMTFTSGEEGCRVRSEAYRTQRTHRLEKYIADNLADAGIVLEPDNELKFEVWGNEMKVSGNFDDGELKIIHDTLKHRARSLSGLYSNYHPMPKSDAVEWSSLQAAEGYLEDTGVSIFDVSLDKNGGFVGLPDDIANFIAENADKPLYIDTGLGWDEPDHTAAKALSMRNAFQSAIHTIESGGYGYYRSKIARLTYKNGVLSC